MPQVYLSHARADEFRAGYVRRALEQRGYLVLDDQGLAPGQDWRREILGLIDRADAVVVLWSPRALKSDWVRAEASHAHAQRKLVPVLMQGAEVPQGFQDINHLRINQRFGSRSTEQLLDAVAYVADLPRRPPVDADPPREERPVDPELPGQPLPTTPEDRYRPISGANRTRVFVAHASSDKPILAPIVEVLLDAGFTVYTFHQIADLTQVQPGTFNRELHYLMQDIAAARRRWWWPW